MVVSYTKSRISVTAAIPRMLPTMKERCRKKINPHMYVYVHLPAALDMPRVTRSTADSTSRSPPSGFSSPSHARPSSLSSSSSLVRVFPATSRRERSRSVSSPRVSRIEHPISTPNIRISVFFFSFTPPLKIFSSPSPPLSRSANQKQAAELLLDGLPDLEGAAVGADEHGLAEGQALLVGGVEAADEELEGGQLGGDLALRGGDGGHGGEDGVVVGVLEAQPQTLAGGVGGRQGLGLEGADGGEVGRVRAAARHERQVARAVHRQRHAEVVLRVRDRGQPETGAGRVLQMRGHLDYGEDSHFRGGNGGNGRAGSAGVLDDRRLEIRGCGETFAIERGQTGGARWARC